MAANEPPTSPRPLTIVDGGREIKVTATAASIIRMIIEQQSYFNAPYVAGVVHLHFSGREQTANLKSDLDFCPQAA